MVPLWHIRRKVRFRFIAIPDVHIGDATFVRVADK